MSDKGPETQSPSTSVNPEIPKPESPARRSLLRAAIATAGAAILGSPRSAGAQSIFPMPDQASAPPDQKPADPSKGVYAPTPYEIGKPVPGYGPGRHNTQGDSNPDAKKIPREKIQPPSDLNKKVESSIEIFKQFISDTPDIKATYLRGNEPKVDLSANNDLLIFLSTDETKNKFLDKEVKRQLAIKGNRSYGGDPAKSYAEDFDQYAGTNLSADSGVQKVLSEEAKALAEAKLMQYSRYFDLLEPSGAVDKVSISISDLSSDRAERLYSIVVAAWVSDKNLGNFIKENINQNDRKTVANLFLAALKRFSDCFGANGDFDRSGINQQSLDDLLQISDNKIYQGYFTEKRNPNSS